MDMTLASREPTYLEPNYEQIGCSVLQSMFRTNRGTVKGYFLAGRTMIWWPVRDQSQTLIY